MSTSTSTHPAPGTQPWGYVNRGGGHPFVVIRLEGQYDGTSDLSLGQMPLEAQVGYLDALAALCADLAEQARQAQVQTGEVAPA